MLLVVAGCGTGVSVSSAAVLDGAFVVREARENGAIRPLVGGALVRFAGGRLTAHASCNTASGPFDVADGRLVVQELGVTMIGCGDRETADDQFLFDALRSRPSVVRQGDSLRLVGPAAQLVLDRLVESPTTTAAAFLCAAIGSAAETGATTSTAAAPSCPPAVPPAVPLVETVWIMDARGDSDYAALGIPDSPQLQFTDGRMTVTAACGRLAVEARIVDATITFGQVLERPSACDPPSGVTFATRFATGDVTAEIHGSGLMMRHDATWFFGGLARSG
jgi:heat shock protein HslJ